MEDKRLKIGKWLAAATVGISFPPDREAVRAELEAHLEDKVLDILRIFPHMTEEEAIDRALSTMGDASEIGRELAKIHRPWWGWLWTASKWALWASMVWALVLWYLSDPWQAGGAARPLGAQEPLTHAQMITAGINPYGPESPTPDPKKAQDLILLATAGETDFLGVENYLLKVSRGALWQDEFGFRTLYLELEAMGLPWEQLSYTVPISLSATDDLGNHYYPNDDVPSVGSMAPHLSASMAHDTPAWRPIFYVEAFNIPEGVEWLRLEYDRAGVTWSIKVPLKEVG